ncbi:MAG: hypothetical protein ACR2QC_05660 [Gammaproteobacteria bacterium]
MPKTQKPKKSKKILACPKCGGREFTREVYAWENYKAIRGTLQYQRTIATDEGGDGVRCKQCNELAPDAMFGSNFSAEEKHAEFMPV